MLHVCVIALLGVLALHDAVPGIAMASEQSLGRWTVSGLVLGVMAILATVQHVIVSSADRMIEARAASLVAGRISRDAVVRSFELADRTVVCIRVLATLMHVAAVLVFGWLDAVRSVIGDVVLVDELVSILPALVVISLSWASYYPLERRVREAMTMRALDTGATMYPVPSRGGFVWMNVRHQLLLSVVPLALITGWSESVERALGLGWVMRVVQRVGLNLADPATVEWSRLGLQLVGVAAVLALSPMLLRVLWETVRLGEGPTRERLLAMCAARRVRVRDLLVWRTGGMMINGAVIGIVGRVRYILLTDALLDQLSEQQVEAVMAHEIAHAKYAHLPWLGACLVGSVGLLGAAGEVGLRVFERLIAPAGMASTDSGGVMSGLIGGLSLGLSVATLALGLVVFGMVSRRFEWQADAFAARHLAESAGEFVTVTAPAAAGMSSALQAVAELNRIPRRRGSWRHGSIAERQRRLSELVGAPMNALVIDRQVRWIKRSTLAAICMIVLIALGERWIAGVVDRIGTPVQVGSGTIQVGGSAE